MSSNSSPSADDIHNISDIRTDIAAAAAAAERRALANVSIDDEKRYAQERIIRQNFRRMLDPGILRPNSKEVSMGSIKTLYTISNNLLREAENPKFAQFKPTNSVIKKQLVEVKGALEYAVALGFRAEVDNFQPLYIFNKHKERELRIGNEILKEHIDRETEKTERTLRAKAEEKALKEAAAHNVLLAYEDDRKTKALRDLREKEAREARVAAGLPPIPSSSSPPLTRRSRRSARMRMPGSGLTLDGRQIDEPGPDSPPYHDDENEDENEDGEV